MFFNELTTFVMDRILEEHMKNPVEREISIYVACVYAIACLHQTQPVKRLPEIRFPSFNAEAVEERLNVLVPEYLLNPLVTLVQTLKEPETQEAYELFQWLFQQHAFMFCLERPVRYCPGGKSPYPKEKHPQVFTNSTKSRLILNSEKLLSDNSFAALSKCYSKYENALSELHGSSGQPIANDTTFLDEVEKAIKDYNHWKTKVVQKRSQKKYKFLETFTLPIIPASTLVESVKEDVKQEFYRACDRYAKLLNGEEVEEEEQENPPPVANVSRRGSSNSQSNRSSFGLNHSSHFNDGAVSTDQDPAAMNRIKLKKEFPIRMPERKNSIRSRKPKVGKKRKQERNMDTPRKKRKKEPLSDEEYFDNNDDNDDEESDARLLKLLNDQF